MGNQSHVINPPTPRAVSHECLRHFRPGGTSWFYIFVPLQKADKEFLTNPSYQNPGRRKTIMQRSRAGSPPITPPPGTHQSSNRRRDRSRNRGYSLPREKSRKREVTLLLCVFHSSGHNWATKSVRFDPNRINDQELWFDIRDTFRMDLQKPWRRIFGFKKVKSIVPIGVR